MNFKLVSDYAPAGDQAQAIKKLVKSIQAGNTHQSLLGVTGSGKTFTMANVIAEINKPTLIMSHNKTLAAQLYSEFKNFFPNNAVEYFVSYFDYYQPEAYIPRSDTYIEKDSSINDEIERLRLSTMGSLMTRKDVIVIASVSCIYGLGDPEDFENSMIAVAEGDILDRDDFIVQLVDILFERNDIAFERGQFRVRGDVVEVRPAYLENTAIRIEFFGDEVERITEINVTSGKTLNTLSAHQFFPAKQFVTSKEKIRKAVKTIQQELEKTVDDFEKQKKLIEAQRIKMRTDYDLEMLQEMGVCQGIENYSRHLTSREKGSRPHTLLDFFAKDSLLIMDESHVTVPQVGAMYEGDKSRKTTLVEHGFRLPSALDNRPLQFHEFMEMTDQRLYVSATLGPFELLNSHSGNDTFTPWKRDEKTSANAAIKKLRKRIFASPSDQSVTDFEVDKKNASLITEQIIRPTGLLDPILTLHPLKGQIDKTIELCRDRVEKKQRVLVTTLTKKTAEDLCAYLLEMQFKASYLHADVDAVERVEILRSLRAGEVDILIGINLLREGLDLPEVSLVCILDADKEGFLRNETSLVQTAGRAARHEEGECYLFCDTITDSVQALLDVTDYRRKKQIAHNKKHNITPRSVERPLQQSLQHQRDEQEKNQEHQEGIAPFMIAENAEQGDLLQVIADLEKEMITASTKLEFERAAHLRDQIKKLKKMQES